MVQDMTERTKKDVQDDGAVREPIRLTYHRKGDYLFPDLTIEEEQVGIQKYGMLRKRFLRAHRRGLYQSMLLTGRLDSHLEGIDQAAEERMGTLMERLLESHPAPDKEEDQMGWAAHMAGLVSMAEETILEELVYS